MVPSTTAILTATEYTIGIFLQIHMFGFFMDLCVHWNAYQYYYFASLGIFYSSGIQDVEVNKVTAYFFCMDKGLLEDFVLKCNQ